MVLIVPTNRIYMDFKENVGTLVRRYIFAGCIAYSLYLWTEFRAKNLFEKHAKTLFRYLTDMDKALRLWLIAGHKIMALLEAM